MGYPPLITQNPDFYTESRPIVLKPNGRRPLTIHRTVYPIYDLHGLHVGPPDIFGVVGSMSIKQLQYPKGCSFRDKQVLADITLQPLEVGALGPDRTHNGRCRKFNAAFNEQLRVLLHIQHRYGSRKILDLKDEPWRCIKRRNTAVMVNDEQTTWDKIELKTVIRVTGEFHLVEIGSQRKRASEDGDFKIVEPETVAYVIEAKEITFVDKSEIADWEW
ncbi:hypothetical protein VNI00_004385 [Paramarasmius palmivorus]|uniref:Uncharacterized protein n=1 Tax=Paramarasmius palmivorus TaxID=297713 RepID=A0AAW0DP67_9AGAR